MCCKHIATSMVVLHTRTEGSVCQGWAKGSSLICSDGRGCFPLNCRAPQASELFKCQRRRCPHFCALQSLRQQEVFQPELEAALGFPMTVQGFDGCYGEGYAIVTYPNTWRSGVCVYVTLMSLGRRFPLQTTLTWQLLPNLFWLQLLFAPSNTCGALPWIILGGGRETVPGQTSVIAALTT